MKKNRIALMAGGGALPVILSERLYKLGLLSLVIVLQGSKERFNFPDGIVCESPIGKINKILGLLKKNKINKVIMIGKIDKSAFLERKGFDLKAFQMLKKLKEGNDMSIFHVIQEELSGIGIEILQQDKFLGDLVVKNGILTKRKPSKAEMNDAEYGIKFAKRLASMDIGQAVVVKNKVITAVEAIEGTDETIRRGASLSENGSIVCKAARPKQDRRFDIPGVGLDTLKIMAQHRCALLALEANSIIIVNPGEVINFADSKKISIIGI